MVLGIRYCTFVLGGSAPRLRPKGVPGRTSAATRIAIQKGIGSAGAQYVCWCPHLLLLLALLVLTVLVPWQGGQGDQQTEGMT